MAARRKHAEPTDEMLAPAAESDQVFDTSAWPQKRPKSSLNPIHLSSILTAVTAALADRNPHGAEFGLPIPQLLQVIAAYAAPFVASIRTIDAGDYRVSIACPIDSEWTLAYEIRSNQFFKFSTVTGNVRLAVEDKKPAGCDGADGLFVLR